MEGHVLTRQRHRNAFRRALALECVERRFYLSSVTFIEPVTIMTEFDLAVGTPAATDVDGDGEQDLVLSSFFRGIRWVEDRGEEGLGEPRRIGRGDSLQIADVDVDVNGFGFGCLTGT